MAQLGLRRLAIDNETAHGTRARQLDERGELNLLKKGCIDNHAVTGIQYRAGQHGQLPVGALGGGAIIDAAINNRTALRIACKTVQPLAFDIGAHTHSRQALEQKPANGGLA